MSYPKSVSRQDLIRALGAFCDALGLEANRLYFPMHISENVVEIVAVVTDEGGKSARADGRFPSGSALAVPIKIKVTD